MTIAIGQRIPDAAFKVKTAEGTTNPTTADLFNGKKAVLVGLPGAFTPTCSGNHVPGYLDNADALKRRGVDMIAIVSVNDHHVMEAWSKALGADGKLVFLADGNADFVRAAGLDIDLSVGGMGVRAKRFSMLVEDGVVKALNVEDKPGVDVSGAAHMLDHLG